jgi:hypothetical protein
MRRVAGAIAAAVLALAACNQTGNQQPSSNAAQSANAASEAPPIPPPGTGPNARTPLAEPKGPIDPKSAEAAGQVVQHYGALIEQGRWTEARGLWSNPAAATEFERRLRGDWTTHLEIGNPRDLEGAAGSIYVTVPALFYNDMESGQPSRLEADVILRRVNDVQGSTASQRRWRIERID